MGEKGQFFVRALTFSYRVSLLLAFYLLFFSAAGDLTINERAIVFVVGLLLALSTRQVSVHAALYITRLRHGEMEPDEREAVTAYLEARGRK